jgi:hypothetical protein
MASLHRGTPLSASTPHGAIATMNNSWEGKQFLGMTITPAYQQQMDLVICRPHPQKKQKEKKVWRSAFLCAHRHGKSACHLAKRCSWELSASMLQCVGNRHLPWQRVAVSCADASASSVLWVSPSDHR